MAPDDLRQRGSLVRHRPGLIVQQPGGVSPAADGHRQSRRRQLHLVLVHDAPQQHPAVLVQRQETRRQMQQLRHGPVVHAGDLIAVAGHAAGVGDIPAQQHRQLKNPVVAGDDPSSHGILT